jgi:hypothetical protein
MSSIWVNILRVLGVLFVAVIIYAGFATARRRIVREMADKWAKDNHLEIIEFKWRPFAGKLLLDKRVTHFVKVRDQGGNLRTGRLFCGTRELGLLEADASIEWSDNRT